MPNVGHNMTTTMGSLYKKMKCLSCANRRHPVDPGRRRSVDISKQLKKWGKQENRVVKLLLLGIGESGKSTITKQMKIIHIDGYSDSERTEKVVDIRRNVKDAILILLGAMNNLNIPLGNSDLETAKEYILSESIKDDFIYPQQFFDYTQSLWNDKGVIECFSRNNEYQLFDSAKYFLDRLNIVRDDQYMPSDQDLLRCRVMTNCINEIKFSVVDRKTTVRFSVFDVGGQQGERRKWIQVFDGTRAILFLVDSSCFDSTLREDTSKNRLIEAMETFEQVWNNRFLKNVDVMLFINKIDLLEEKIVQGRSLNSLVDSIDPSHRYHSLLQTFKTFDKVRDSEREEFVSALPRCDPATNSCSSIKSPSKPSRVGRKKSSLPQLREDVPSEVIRTAVFIKRLFTHLANQPTVPDRDHHSHKDHSCEHYFTCAVDTHTIQKVLEGCRSFIIKKVLTAWGLL